MKTSTSRIFRTPVFVAILATGAWMLVSSCAVRVSPLSQPDPTDPMAEIGAESPYRPDLSSDPALRSESKSPASAHAHDAEGGDDRVYACPMHPDVTGPEGSQCQLCGMSLVLRKDPSR